MKGKEEMSESTAVIVNNWSTLDTVDDFDHGINSTKDFIATKETISKTVVKSLFIESLIDQLCKLLEKDPIKRHKLYEGICSKLYEMHLIEETYNIEELASLRGHYQQALLDVMISPDARLCSMPCLKLGSCRYAIEYEEICFIASGGFGQVFKARNKLDQVIYAVKKIFLKFQNLDTFVRKLNEVKTLAKLNHPNIVQYKAAWLEPIFNIIPPIPPAEVNNVSSTDSDVVLFQSNNSNSKSNCASQKDSKDKNLALCQYQAANVQRPGPQMSAVLYVVMQLCDETLCERLTKRNHYNQPLDIRLIFHIMTHTVAGVQYIHSCNVVHHDLKPRNIFLSSDLKSVQVGDFGLSCRLQGHDHADCPLEVGQFGTPLYAAPEQLRGRCDSKSDMFSLGLIFVELLTVFSTEMERVKILTKVRSGQLPPSIPSTLVPVIKSLISHKPSKRPTANELMTTLQKLGSHCIHGTKGEKTGNEGTSMEGVEGQDLLQNKDREITELRQKLAQKESEIAQLKDLIKKISV